MKLCREVAEFHTLQRRPPRLDWLEEHVFSVLPKLYEAYERDRPLIAEGRLVEVRYEDLVDDPKRILRRIYEQLDLGDFAPAEASVDTYLADKKDYKITGSSWSPSFGRRSMHAGLVTRSVGATCPKTATRAVFRRCFRPSLANNDKV